MIADHELVCFCSQVTACDIRRARDEGARTLDAIRRITGACTVGRCKELSPRGRCCAGEIKQVLEE